MKSLFYSLLFITGGLFFSNCANGQNTPVKKSASAQASEESARFQVLGNCGMCRKTIEKAAKSAGASNAFWDEDNHVLAVNFDKNKTSGDAILKSVAQSGYDNQAYKAPESAYNNLHSCCQYDRSGAPSTAKSCEEKN